MHLRGRFFLSVVSVCLAAATSAQGQPAKPGQAPKPDAAQADKQAAPKKEETPKTIDELTKDFKKQEGLLTVYRQTKDAGDTIYVEVPEASMGKLMLLQITSGSGLGDTSAFVFHGMPIADDAVVFKPYGSGHVQLVAPDLRHRSNTPEGKRGIERSFPDSVLGTFEIKARQPERKSVLIDVSQFFRSDIDDLAQVVDAPGPSGYALNPTTSRVDTIKDFPDNIVIRSVYGLNRKSPMSGGPNFTTWAVSFNISSLPDNDYQPRYGDPRVGYFTVSYEDLSDAKNYDDNVNMIQRWDIRKADPSLPLSPPKEPIVFYIDNAVPLEYRDAVRKGLLMFNEAFEKIGIKDAIVVKQMPDNADWDIADVRYNTIRWTTGMPFAIALFRANPLTGQILNACINMDAGFASFGGLAFDNIVDPMAQPARMPVPKKYAAQLCDLQAESREVTSEGLMLGEMLAGGAPFDQKGYIDSYITQVVAHEFGHCLGLRHNFVASTEYNFSELGDGQFVRDHGTTASVMDYLPFNTAAIGKKGVPFYSGRIGDYDKWAIDYGYEPFPSSTPQAERPFLDKIASEDGQPGHAYQSDGSADDFDPYVERFDFGSDPLAFASAYAQLGRRLRSRADAKITSGRSYWDFTQAYMYGLNLQLGGAARALKFIGGGRLGTGFVGDQNGAMPYTPVSAAKQREALGVLVDAAFSKSSFNLSQGDIAKLTFNPNSQSNEVPGRARLYPVQSQLELAQKSLLNALFDGDLLARMHANEFRTNDTLTIAELFHRLNVAVWSELDNHQPVTALRRDLQRDHLAILINLALGQEPGAPYDSRDLAVAQLKSLRTRLVEALPQTKDAYTNAHYSECVDKITRALTAQATVPADQ